MGAAGFVARGRASSRATRSAAAGRQPDDPEKVAEMQTEIALGPGRAEAGRMLRRGKCAPSDLALKRNNWGKALEIARAAATGTAPRAAR